MWYVPLPSHMYIIVYAVFSKIIQSMIKLSASILSHIKEKSMHVYLDLYLKLPVY